MSTIEFTSTAHHIIAARGGGRVERCHAIPHQGSYSVAAHSWGVAMLMLHLFPADFPRLAQYCLTHDIPECWTGDIIAPVMRYAPGLKEAIAKIEDKLMERINLPSFNHLSPEDHRKLKACDWLEFWLWSSEQMTIGNLFAEQGLREIENYIAKMGLPAPADRVYDQLRAMSVVTPQAGVMEKVCSNG